VQHGPGDDGAGRRIHPRPRGLLDRDLRAGHRDLELHRPLHAGLVRPPIQPSNYIWRGFVLVTEWAVRACALVTPRYVRPVFLPLVAFFWLYWFVRPAFYVASLLLGIAPRGISG
jgi:hypothetical protein